MEAKQKKILGKNKRARFNYHIEETLECGIALTGTEVKSIKDNRFSFGDAYVKVENDELWLVQFHISHYPHGNLFNHPVDRKRRLLAHKREIIKLRRKVDERGFTLIPTMVYLVNGKVKIEVGVGKGKKLHDKRETIKSRDEKRNMDRIMKDKR